MQTALDAVAPGGRIVLVGLGAEKCCVPTMQTVFKEIDFMGSFRYTNTVSFFASAHSISSFICRSLCYRVYGAAGLQVVSSKHAKAFCMLRFCSLRYSSTLKC